MLKNHWMLYLGIAICLLTLPSASAASLIKNGDFAVWKNGAPTNWTLAANKQNVVCDKNSGLANDGYSLCVNIDTEVGKVLGEIRQTVKVAPHQQLKLSGWLKSNKKGAALFMIKLRSKRKELKRITTSLSTSEWSQVERIFNTENADNIQILCRYKQHATFVGSKCWFGNVQLVPVSKDHKNSATSPSPLIKKDLGLKVYVSLEGAGEQNGKDWSNAMPATNGGLQRAYQQLGDSGSLFLGSGTYPGFTMQLRSGGKSVTQMKQIIGVDTGKGLPLFTSDFDKHKPETTGAVLFTALDGVCNWEIRNIQVKGYHSTLIMKGNHHNVTLANLVISESRDCLYLFGGATAEKPNNYSSNITIKDCTFKYYTKRAVRMLNGFNQIEIINCHADGGGKEWATERFAIGFQCYNKVEHVYNNNITFVDCTSQNHWDPNGDKYWNADGFAMERRNRNVRYIR